MHTKVTQQNAYYNLKKSTTLQTKQMVTSVPFYISPLSFAFWGEKSFVFLLVESGLLGLVTGLIHVFMVNWRVNVC